jgi:chromosome segregation ATPase
MSTKSAGKPKRNARSLTSELNRQLQALQSDKDCLILENRRLLKKIEVLEEIKTALRAQEGKAAAKAAMSIELEHSLRDMKMKLEVTEQKLANAQKMKIGVDELRAQLAKVELDSLELKDKINSLENLKSDMKLKLDSQNDLLNELCGLMVALWKKEHSDENPPTEPTALRDWIKGRMSSADKAKAAADNAKKQHEESLQALEVKLDEIQAILDEKEVALQKAAVTMNLDKARIEQLELELKNMYVCRLPF